jgi:hypothetical protein
MSSYLKLPIDPRFLLPLSIAADLLFLQCKNRLVQAPVILPDLGLVCGCGLVAVSNSLLKLLVLDLALLVDDTLTRAFVVVLELTCELDDSLRSCTV